MTDRSYGDLTASVQFSDPMKPTFSECMAFFTQFIKKFSLLTDEDIADLDQYFEYQVLKKNDIIFEPGKLYQEMLFICKGSCKYYYEDNNGKHIITFITEGSFTAPAGNFYNQTPCENGAICLEETIGVVISHRNFMKLLKERPNYERAVIEHNHVIMMELQRRISTFQSLDALGRYNLLLQKKPDFFHRFSLQDISNYLGIKPETLSRLRSDKSKRN